MENTTVLRKKSFQCYLVDECSSKMIINVSIYHRLKIFIFRILEGGEDVHQGVENLTRVIIGVTILFDEHGE